MTEIGWRTIRNGQRILTFRAAVLGSATSHRGSTPRWSELVVYRMPDGKYVVSKIGRSTVAHRPDCLRVNRRMVSWGSARVSDEFIGPRSPCPDCRPDVDHLAADTMLEVTRYRAILAHDAESAAQALQTEDRAALVTRPKLVQDVLAQCAQADPNFARYAEAVSAAPRALENTTRTP